MMIAPPPVQIEVTVAPAAHRGPLTGRLVVFITKDSTPEPRLSLSLRGPAVFGADIHEATTGVITDTNASYPFKLSTLPPGDYYAQAVVNVYEQVHRSDGHTIWVHLNDGRVEFFNTATGNLYSDVKKIHIGRDPIRLTVTHVMPGEPKPVDTEWLKHVRVQSAMLSKFWGHPVYVNANVLLPKGYEQHPSSYYPSVYSLGHGTTPFGFTTDSTDKEGGPTEVRRGATIGKMSGLENGYDFYKSWTSDGFPRVIAISLEQETPYFPDSYSVNSANDGPYGDAILQEVIPYLEEHFRIIRQPYARHIEGASTSGWQTLALALQHPDDIGGAWVLQPDPIDFRHYQQTNIYDDTNAFVLRTGPFTTTERPFQRTVAGQVLTSVREISRFEDVLGSHGRSGYQLEAWEAVYGPVGADGYPVPLWNKRTGTIDKTVAAYMRDHGFDLRDYAERNWATLGPKLAGKLHFFAGDMDNFYLNLAVYDFEEMLRKKGEPTDFTYGRPEKGHGWHSFTWAEMVQKMGATMKDSTGAWHY